MSRGLGDVYKRQVHGYLLYPLVFNIVKDTYRIMKHFLDGDGLEQEDEAAWLELLGTD